MACCAGADGCPMHAAGHDQGVPEAVTQSDADRCCGAAEQDNASSSSVTLALGVSIAPVASPVPLMVPATAVQPDAWRRRLPLPGSPPAQHLLLSVLIV